MTQCMWHAHSTRPPYIGREKVKDPGENLGGVGAWRCDAKAQSDELTREGFWQSTKGDPLDFDVLGRQ